MSEQLNVWERRPQPNVQAVRWTGDNLEQVREVFPGIGEEYMRDKGCYPGCYVISPSKGRVYFMGQCAFEEEFQPAALSRSPQEMPPVPEFGYRTTEGGVDEVDLERAEFLEKDHYLALRHSAESLISDLRSQVEQKDAEINRISDIAYMRYKDIDRAEKAEQALSTAQEEVALGRKKYIAYRDEMVEAITTAKQDGIREALEAVEAVGSIVQYVPQRVVAGKSICQRKTNITDFTSAIRALLPSSESAKEIE